MVVEMERTLSRTFWSDVLASVVAAGLWSFAGWLSQCILENSAAGLWLGAALVLTLWAAFPYLIRLLRARDGRLPAILEEHPTLRAIGAATIAGLVSWVIAENVSCPQTPNVLTSVGLIPIVFIVLQTSEPIQQAPWGLHWLLFAAALASASLLLAGPPGSSGMTQVCTEVVTSREPASFPVYPHVTRIPDKDAPMERITVTGCANIDACAVFSVYVLYRGAFWDYGSVEVARDIRGNQVDFEKLFERTHRDLASHRGLIFVGMASKRGNEVAERERAERRADQLQGWFGGADGVALFTWNLGKHRLTDKVEDHGPGDTDREKTRVQRTAMIIAIDRRSEALRTFGDLGHALTNAFRRHADFILARSIADVQRQAEDVLGDPRKYWPGIDGYEPGLLTPTNAPRDFLQRVPVAALSHGHGAGAP